MQPNNRNSSDEIDLGQLLQLIGKGFTNLGYLFLRLFIYLKKNALVLGILVFVGVAAGLVLNSLVSKRLKTSVIVRPNFDSSNYLSDAISEIKSKIAIKDTVFFRELDIAPEEIVGVNVQIEPIEELVDENTEETENLKYLELLQNFRDQDFVTNILRSEFSRKSIVDYRITFSYQDPVIGNKVSLKLMKYINSSPYFESLKKVYRENAESRIIKNALLIQQIDTLIFNYSKGLTQKGQRLQEGMVFMENEGGLNIPSLLSLKNRLTEEIEEKKIVLATQGEVVSILNMGKTQHVEKTFMNKWVISLPVLLIGIFLLGSFLKYLNRKSKEVF